MKTINPGKLRSLAGDLQTNLKNFYAEYGQRFYVAHKKIKLAAVMKKRILPNGVNFFQIYHGDMNRNFELMPLKIDFVDIIETKLNDNAYIANIHRDQGASGSDMVEICIALCRYLGVHVVRLYDGTMVTCEKNRNEFDLSFQKLIETRKTFYMRFGFENDPADGFFLYRFKNLRELKKARNELIDAIRNIKVSDLIKEYKLTLGLISKCVSENDEKNIVIWINDPNWSDRKNLYRHPHSQVMDLFSECKEILYILRKYKHKFLYEIMADTFKKNCEDYGLIDKYILRNKRYGIQLGSMKVEREYMIDIALLRMIRYSGYKLSLR